LGVLGSGGHDDAVVLLYDIAFRRFVLPAKVWLIRRQSLRMDLLLHIGVDDADVQIVVARSEYHNGQKKGNEVFHGQIRIKQYKTANNQLKKHNVVGICWFL